MLVPKGEVPAGILQAQMYTSSRGLSHLCTRASYNPFRSHAFCRRNKKGEERESIIGEGEGEGERERERERERESVEVQREGLYQ